MPSESKSIAEARHFAHETARENAADMTTDLRTLQLTTITNAVHRIEVEQAIFAGKCEVAFKKLNLAIKGDSELGTPGLAKGYQDNHKRIKRLEALVLIISGVGGTLAFAYHTAVDWLSHPH